MRNFIALLAGALLSFAPAQAAPTGLENQKCLDCHAVGKKAINVAAGDETRTLAQHDPAKFAAGVHGKLDCVGCHTNIVDAKEKHQLGADAKPDCASCHEKLWSQAQAEGKATEKARLKLVVDNIGDYKNSFHARENADKPGHPKASCAECHSTHNFAVPIAGSPERKLARLTVSESCGTNCHEDQLESWAESVHGVKMIEDKDTKPAICIDCHTAHKVQNTSADPYKTTVTKDCGNCHEENFKTYRESLHGKINALGYGNTAKCYDCHGSHNIVKVDDPLSKAHPDRRLKTCKSCHDGKKASLAADGFATFPPHGNAHNFEKYPQIWLAAKGMAGLLIGTFAFFWVHLILWLYREYMDRKQGKTRPHIDVKALGLPEGKHFRRFGPWARAGHLIFALTLMILTLTGMTLMYASSSWAPTVMQMLGGPKVAGMIHRVNAVIFIIIFLIHLAWVTQYLIRNWSEFKIFGSNSVIPGLQDLKDCIAMFKWFLGKGERPIFDRWTYWEKFDYWAPFWGVSIVGFSGAAMMFPTLTATYLPGWVFNVAAIAHGEEAFLAAVFLFTVHFFNNHFRPDKFPLDIVMFTGTVPLEHFAREHTIQYKRLLESGELAKHLVDAPSPAFTTGSKILGTALIAFGLTLLALVTVGFFQTL